jgi:hypothetical protein
MNIQNKLKNIKDSFDTAITTASFNGKNYDNGNKAKEALIRSQQIINYIHEFIKGEFARCGVPGSMIYPPIGNSSPEIKMKGFLKSKNQDVSIIPFPELIRQTKTNNPEVEKILTVNIRSQLSSLNKNIDTLYERTFAEALNLHLSYPKQCLGEVYLIPTHEYDDKAMFQNRVAFRSASKIDDYIRMFQAINGRNSTDGNEYKYERVCLLIADFRQKIPKLYNSIEELKGDGLVSEESKTTLENLTINNFAEDMLNIYVERFGYGIIV